LADGLDTGGTVDDEDFSLEQPKTKTKKGEIAIAIRHVMPESPKRQRLTRH
jgi:hypothetical protein